MPLPDSDESCSEHGPESSEVESSSNSQLSELEDLELWDNSDILPWRFEPRGRQQRERTEEDPAIDTDHADRRTGTDNW